MCIHQSISTEIGKIQRSHGGALRPPLCHYDSKLWNEVERNCKAKPSVKYFQITFIFRLACIITLVKGLKYYADTS